MSRDDAAERSVGDSTPTGLQVIRNDASTSRPNLHEVSIRPCTSPVEINPEVPQRPSSNNGSEQSPTDATSQNGLPHSVAVSDGDDESELVLQSPSHKKSPIRGVLRAVSSITITDIEAFEEGISNMREKDNVTDTPLSASRKFSPSTLDASPSVPTRTSSNRGAFGKESSAKTISRPRRGGPSGRRRKAPTDTSDWDLGDEVIDEAKGPSRLPFDQQDCEVDNVPVDKNKKVGLPKRRKSFDILPNVPRRTASARNLVRNGTDTDDSDEDNDVDHAEIQRLVQSLYSEVHRENSRSQPAGPLGPRRRNSVDMLPNVPRRRNTEVVPPTTDLFDRFNCEQVPLVRHQFFDEMFTSPMPPTSKDSPIKPPRAHESESEQEASPFKAREFVVSLDDLEDKKTNNGEMPKRRRSFDALPTPPRRCLEEFAGLDTDDDDADVEDEEINPISARRRSLDDVRKTRRRQSKEALKTGDEEIFAYNVDLPPSRTQGSCEANDADRPVRRLSADVLPAVPRRRSPSDTSSDDEMSSLPLKTDNDSVRPKDVLPNAPRRMQSVIPSSQVSRSSSCSSDDFLNDAGGSFGVSVSDEYCAFEDLPPQRLKSGDTLPSVPIRDFSIPDIDVDNMSSDDARPLGRESSDRDTDRDFVTDLESVEPTGKSIKKDGNDNREDSKRALEVLDKGDGRKPEGENNLEGGR